MRKSKYSEDEIKKQTEIAAGLYADGCSLSQIGKITGISSAAIRIWLIKAGVQMRKANRPNRIECDVEKLKGLAGSGATIKEISEEMHASEPTVNKWLQEYGITINLKARKARGQKKKEDDAFIQEQKPVKKCGTCIYRSGVSGYGCNYNLIVKKSRRCGVIGCIRYVKGKRIRLSEDFTAV